MPTTTTTSHEARVAEAAATLARAIQDSAAWTELQDARKAAAADERFARMIARQADLAGLQGVARERREEFDGKLLVDLIALQDQIRSHELYARQQESWSAVTALLQQVNEAISHELGFDFASNAAYRRGGCCG